MARKHGDHRQYNIFNSTDSAELLDSYETLAEVMPAAQSFAASDPNGFVLVVASDTGRVWEVTE
jgi:hypothetical protein